MPEVEVVVVAAAAVAAAVAVVAVVVAAVAAEPDSGPAVRCFERCPYCRMKTDFKALRFNKNDCSEEQ